MSFNAGFRLTSWCALLTWIHLKQNPTFPTTSQSGWKFILFLLKRKTLPWKTDFYKKKAAYITRWICVWYPTLDEVKSLFISGFLNSMKATHWFRANKTVTIISRKFQNFIGVVQDLLSEVFYYFQIFRKGHCKGISKTESNF